MKISYQILDYSDENLLVALLNEKITESSLKKRNHFNYFVDYLGKSGLDAKTILVEDPYISKAYLVDYSNYYSTCFQEYARNCKRVHFFKETFDNGKFEKELLGNKSTFLNHNYLGYIVVKPLPDSIIGPTLLKTYSTKDDGITRHYPSCRKYSINLFGKELTLNSLVYQEQDTIVAACASVAIWSAFHKTSTLFEAPLPSPSEITKRAGNPFNNYGRTFPNPGLSIAQICKAIESNGLVSELIISSKFQSSVTLAKRIVYAYNRAGLPILLFLNFGEDGGHLVTINGYSDIGSIKKEATKEISLIADNIIKFYAHDDQVGPFARLEFPGNENISTSWKDDKGNNITAKIHSIIIPVYRKIRIKYQDVYDKVSYIDYILFKTNIFTAEIEWDIYLIESNKYKNEILLNSNINDTIKKEVIIKDYPKYIWVCTAIANGVKLFDFIYDSTDIATGNFCIHFNLLFTNKLFKDSLKANFVKYKAIYTEERGGPRFGEDLFNDLISQLSS